jgi:glycosyltransferase involved in cell wall biosynthesis
MEEVAGDAAVLVAPGSVDGLADALDAHLAGDGPAAARRRERGLAVVADHTWAASARRHLDAYRHAAAAGPRRPPTRERPARE